MPDLSMIRSALGQAAKDQSDEQVLALAATAVTALGETRTKLRTTLGDKAKDKDDAAVLALCADHVEANAVLAQELNVAEGKLADAERQVLTLSADAEPDLDPRVRNMIVKTTDQQRTLALSALGMSDAQAKLIDALFDDASGQPTALALSAATADGSTLEFELWSRLTQLGKDLLKTQNRITRGTPAEPLALGADDAAAANDPAKVTDARIDQLLAEIGRRRMEAASK